MRLFTISLSLFLLFFSFAFASDHEAENRVVAQIEPEKTKVLPMRTFPHNVRAGSMIIDGNEQKVYLFDGKTWLKKGFEFLDKYK